MGSKERMRPRTKSKRILTLEKPERREEPGVEGSQKLRKEDSTKEEVMCSDSHPERNAGDNRRSLRTWMGVLGEGVRHAVRWR